MPVYLINKKNEIKTKLKYQLSTFNIFLEKQK